MSDPSLFDLLDWDQLSNADGESYLLKVKQLVSQHRGQRFSDRSGSGVNLKIAGIDDTVYSEDPKEVDSWGLFYLPQEVKMCVFAVVDGPLVLMTCEDRKVYGYDGENLHEVASDLRNLCDVGLRSQASWRMVTINNIRISVGHMTPLETYLRRFRHNAVMIITYMLYWAKYTPGSKHLANEILQSIFFLGEINVPKYEPKDIFDHEMLNTLNEKYPRPLECYRTHVPKRSPFSCVLDMIVLRLRETQRIKDRLKRLSYRLRPDPLTSTAMCVTTYKGSNYYGVSMSKNLKTETNCNAAEIMIAASCLSYWDEYVAGAVMTYYPESTDFDGTIKLPDSVTCETFNIKRQTKMEPCKHCRDLFGLPTTETKDAGWTPGNCAEAESVSNLFKNQNAVKEAARPTSTTYTAENVNRAVVRVREKLRNQLRLDFQWPFYEP